MKNNHFLKSILTTTSTLALLVGAKEASAAQLSAVAANPAHTLTASDFSPNWVSGNSITLGAGNNLMVNSVTTIGGIALNGYAPGIITVSANATIGSIANVNGGEGFTVDTRVSDGVTLILNGTTTVTGFGLSASGANNYDALGNVTIGSTASATATTLNVNMSSGNTTFSNTFDAHAGNTGAVLTVTNDGNIFGGNLGYGGRLAGININGNTQVGGANTVVSDISSGATTIANNKTLTIDSSASVLVWDGNIDGAGSLSTTQTPLVGSYSTHFNNHIGANTPLSSVSFGDRTSIYLGGNNISAASLYLGVTSSMYNPGAVNISGANGITLTGNSTVVHTDGDAPSITSTSGININGHTLTFNQGSASVNASFQTTGNGGDTGGTLALNGADVTLYGNVGASGNALTAINFVTDNTLTVSGNISIYSPITNSTNNKGSLVISGASLTLAGNVGTSESSLKAINFVTDNTLTISGARDIYSPITTSTNGAGWVRINGGNVGITGDVGTNTHALSVIYVDSGNTLVFSGNVRANNLWLNNTSAAMTMLGGNANTANVISANIYNSGTVDGQGTINVGDGTSASHVNFTGSVGKHSCAIKYFNVIGSKTSGNASTATISANSYFSGASGGISIGQNATVNVASGATLAFSDGATIEGSSDGCGTLIMTKASTIPIAIGATHSLATVRLSGFNSGEEEVLGKAIHATTLDLTGSSIILLDSSASLANITNFTTSDNSGSIKFTAAAGGNLSIGNIDVPLSISTTHQLTTTGATKAITFEEAGGTLIAANNASIYNVLSDGRNYGTLETLGNATFTGAIGNGTHSLSSLSLTGTSSQTVAVTTATDIYAGSIAHSDVELDLSANDVTMHGNYSGTDAILTLGEKKLTIPSGNVVSMSGTLTINATYTGDEQTILDLSGATSLDASGITTLTLNIDNGILTPMSSDTIKIIKAPEMLTTSNSMKVSMGTSDPKWSITSFGTLAYDVSVLSAPVKTVKPILTKDFAPVGATADNILQAVGVIGASNLNIKDDGSITFKTNDSSILSVVSNSTSTDTIPVVVGDNTTAVPSNVIAYVQQYNTDALQKGWLGTLGQTMQEQQNLYVDQGTSDAFALIAAQQGLISKETENLLLTRHNTIAANNLMSNLIGLAIRGGEALVHEAITRISSSANNASNNQFGSIVSRVSFLYSNNITASTKLDASNDNIVVAEEAQGIAAGSSADNKFGVWASMSAGKANQKAHKGSSGFNSFSNGLTIGCDTMLSDYNSIGFAVSNAFNHIKHKDMNLGDKTDTSSWVGAIYGNHQFKNNWFLRGAALFNRTGMNSKELRPMRLGGYGVAKAKYHIISYGGEMAIGFMHSFKNGISLTPSIGFRMLHNNKSSYAQEGDTNQNNKIAIDAINNYSALGGLSLARSIVKEGIIFTPEAHANVQYGINQQTPKGTFVSPFSPNQTNNFIGNKSSKIISTYGLSLTGARDGVEMGINADVTIADKYIGYQGALKLKVNF